MSRIYKNYRGPIRNASPVICQIQQILDDQNISFETVEKAIGINNRSMSSWRSGRHEPFIFTVELVANYLGKKLVLQDL